MSLFDKVHYPYYKGIVERFNESENVVSKKAIANDEAKTRFPWTNNVLKFLDTIDLIPASLASSDMYVASMKILCSRIELIDAAHWQWKSSWHSIHPNVDLKYIGTEIFSKKAAIILVDQLSRHDTRGLPCKFPELSEVYDKLHRLEDPFKEMDARREEIMDARREEIKSLIYDLGKERREKDFQSFMMMDRSPKVELLIDEDKIKTMFKATDSLPNLLQLLQQPQQPTTMVDKISKAFWGFFHK